MGDPNAYTTAPQGEQNPAHRGPTIDEMVAHAYHTLTYDVFGSSGQDLLNPQPQQQAQPTQTATDGTSGQTAGHDDVVAALKAAGFSGAALDTMLMITGRESSFQPGATGDVKLENSTWGPSVGLFQIRTLKNQLGTGGVRDEQFLRQSIENQARAAWEISKGGTDFTPWSTYRRSK